VETREHLGLKDLATAWLISMGCRAVAHEVPCPVARFRVDAAGWADRDWRAGADPSSHESIFAAERAGDAVRVKVPHDHRTLEAAASEQIAAPVEGAHNDLVRRHLQPVLDHLRKLEELRVQQGEVHRALRCEKVPRYVHTARPGISCEMRQRLLGPTDVAWLGRGVGPDP
jgi:hypothetical protein